MQISPLLSTCVDACRLGCREIRAVESKRRGGASSPDDDGESSSVGLDVSLKDVSDIKSALTEADRRAQAAIVGALRSEWGPDLTIVGEEDGDDDVEAILSEMKFDPLDRTMFFDDELGEGGADIDPSDIIVYVDPLDGTREFVEGRLANCQSLVGIAVGGEAVAGAVGLPFPAGDLSTEATIVYGLADFGTGVVGEPLTRGPFPLDHNIDGVKYPRPHIASGDSTAEVMVAAREAAVNRFKGSSVLYGGAGNKILGAALGEVSASVQHKYGGPWDVCAPEAIIRGFGGRITTLFGEEMRYGPNYPPRFNKRGYVATPSGSDVDHDALVAALLAQPAVQQYRKEADEARAKEE